MGYNSLYILFDRDYGLWLNLRFGGFSMGRESDLDNHANQLNPNTDAYWKSRGWEDRPDDWEDRAEDDDKLPEADGAS